MAGKSPRLLPVVVVYAVALPAYVATGVITRGLIAMRDTRTPLITNSLQLLTRAVFMSLAVSRLGIVTIPAAFALSARLETLVLGAALLHKTGVRIAADQVRGANEGPGQAVQF